MPRTKFMTLSRAVFVRNVSSFRQKVGLLTGTFDPVHRGHVALARAAQTACALDEVWFLVNPEPRHKQGVTALSDRMAMVRLALHEEAGLREGEPSDGAVVKWHTTAEFKLLTVRHPELDFVFIVGADVLDTLSDWEDADAARQLSYAAARRPGVDIARVEEGLQVQWFDLKEYTGASSRKMQAELAAGVRPAELDKHVLEYIREHGLYP